MPYRLRQLVTIALCMVIPTAHALADDEARRAILELRQQVRQMTDQNAQARILLSDQMDALRREITQLRGQLEQLQWQLQQATRGNAPRSSPPKIDATEQASYDAAAEQFRAGRYDEAAAGFASFLTAYPRSTLAAQAQFYRGSSLYAARKYQEAARVLQTMAQAHPQDARAADALLIVAVCQVELNALQDARVTLQSIVQQYPQSQTAQTAQERLKLLR